MIKPAVALAVGSMLSAVLVQGNVARAATASPDDQRRMALKVRTQFLDAQLDRLFRQWAERGRLSAEDEARLSHEVATAEALLATVGPQASLQEKNGVRSAADRLRLMKREEATAGELGRAGDPLAGTGVITGSVTNANTAAPLFPASVFIYDCGGTYITTAVTDASGVYTTGAVLETGPHYARVQRSGFAPELYGDVLYPANGDETSGAPIHVTSGTTTSNVNFALTSVSGGAISGTVTYPGAGALLTDVYIFDSAGVVVTSVSSNGPGGAYVTTVPLPSGTY
jgi:hypothetical protein